MSAVSLVPEAGASSPVAELYDRIRKWMHSPTVPNGYRAMANAPGFLSDMLDNHHKVMADGAVDRKTKELIAVAVSAVAGCEYCLAAHARLARRFGLTDGQIGEALGLASIMSAHNHVQKFRDFSGDEDLKKWWPPLAESLMKNRTLTDLQMELIVLCVSAYNGCPTCIKVHTGKAKKAGANQEQIQEAIAVLGLMAMYTTFLKAIGLENDLK